MFLPRVFEFVAYCLLLLIPASRPVIAANTGAPAQAPNNTNWNGWGGNIYNNRWLSNTDVNSTSVNQLVQNCKLSYSLGVSATPVAINNIVYYPTYNGSFYALNLGTCEYVWEVNVAQVIYDFATPTTLQSNNSLPVSRTSPQIYDGILYFATQIHALLVAVDVNTGDVLATVQVNNHSLAIVTMSPTVYDGKIFIGASSDEESATLDPGYDCCTFIGNFAAFSFDSSSKTFTKIWSLNTLPSNQGWSGVGVWGSQPSIDTVRNQVFFGTGNTYIYPSEYEKCVNESSTCLPDDVWQESVIAADIATGNVNWRRTISPLDGWVEICGNPGATTSSSPLCPGEPGPDSDFAMAPTFVPAALGDGTTGNDSVVVGQKNGKIYNLNAVTGDTQWLVAVGGDNEGSWLSWGIAVDDTNVYFTSINYGSKNWTIQPSGTVINNSAWGAITLKAGEPVWEVPCTDHELAYSPPGLVEDIVWVGQSGSSTVNVSGAVLALSKTTGSTLKSFPIDTVQDGGISVHGGFVMFGTGYHYRNPFELGSFYVFGLPDAIAAAKAEATATASSSGTASTGSLTTTAAKKNAANRSSVDGIMTTIYPMALLAVFLGWFS